VLCDVESMSFCASKVDVQCFEHHVWEFGNFPEVGIHTADASHGVEVAKPPPELKISPLQYVDAMCDGVKIVALCDSGSQIPALSSRLFKVSDERMLGTVNLQGIVGSAVTVPLMTVNVKLAGDVQCEQVTEELQLTCAVTELNAPNYDVILPIDVVDELRSVPAVNVFCMPVMCSPLASSANAVGDAVGAVDTSTITDLNDRSNSDVCDVDCLGMSERECDAYVLFAEQQSDASLSVCWEQAKVNKSDFVVSEGVLYHKNKVEGQPIWQLCVQESRRTQVLKLAHDSMFGCHL